MQPETFQEQLRAGGAYETGPGNRGVLDQLFGRVDAWYYGLVLRIVLDANRRARAGLRHQGKVGTALRPGNAYHRAAAGRRGAGVGFNDKVRR